MGRWTDVNVVPDKRVGDLLRELPAKSADALTLNEGLSVARRAGAAMLVMGDTFRLGKGARIVANVFDARSGNRIRSVTQQAVDLGFAAHRARAARARCARRSPAVRREGRRHRNAAALEHVDAVEIERTDVTVGAYDKFLIATNAPAPWTGRTPPANANTASARRRGPAPVGGFSRAVTPDGLQDMSGNVWEWTSSTLRAVPGAKTVPDSMSQYRVIRGGAFDTSDSIATGWVRGYLQATAGCAADDGFPVRGGDRGTEVTIDPATAIQTFIFTHWRPG